MRPKEDSLFRGDNLKNNFSHWSRRSAVPWVSLCSVLAACSFCVLAVGVDSQVIQDNGSDDAALTSHVRFLDPPTVLRQRRKVVVQYHCDEEGVVGLELVVNDPKTESSILVFSKVWKCVGPAEEAKRKTVRLRLPDSLAYRPDYFNKKAWLVDGAKVKVWLVDRVTWETQSRDSLYTVSRLRDFFRLRVMSPYSRPYKRPLCAVWYWAHAQRAFSLSDRQVCPAEEEIAHLLTYPAVLNGHPMSINRQLTAYTDSKLEATRQEMKSSPRFSLEMWLYILDFCPSGRHSTCGIFTHITTSVYYLSPVLSVLPDGRLQVFVQSASIYPDIRNTMNVLRKHVWTRLLFTVDHRTWTIHVHYGRDLEPGFTVEYSSPREIYLDDTEGLFMLGGIDAAVPSIVGYLGKVDMYRGRVVHPDQLHPPSPDHPMFELHLTRREEKCQAFLTWLSSAIRIMLTYRNFLQANRQGVCPSVELEVFAAGLTPPLVSQCPLKSPPRRRGYRHVTNLLRGALSRHTVNRKLEGDELEAYSRSASVQGNRKALGEISDTLVELASEAVKSRGLREAGKVVMLLKQSACLGNDDAMFSLAALLNHGMGREPDEIQSLAFYMLGALNKHPQSTMALGHRHMSALDGAPFDLDAAYMYFKVVADKSREDKEMHRNTDVLTEKIRIIDEVALSQQTSEVGDIYLWLKDQAAKGVTTAQQELGQMLYWGSRGVNRNLRQALDVYRQGAMEGNADSIYNYGIMQYRGMGGEINQTEGEDMIRKAANMNHPHAVTALGWLALEKHKNYTEALRLFQLAKKLGHMDAGFYLGHMYNMGFVPGSPVDLDKALPNYLWSAQRGQLDAGVLLALLRSRGTPGTPRMNNVAANWARYIAEQNAALAQPLRTAINAFRDGNSEYALYLYLLLAETGLEVANFNLAYLCEDNQAAVSAIISKECVWRHYNMSTQREMFEVDSYALIKMGDNYWYGCTGTRKPALASIYYSLAAQKGDPHALFNLAYMLEEGATIPRDVWLSLNLNPPSRESRLSLLLNLYSRCRESSKTEAFLPCSLAWFRIWLRGVWTEYYVYLKISSVVGLLVVFSSSSCLIYLYLLQRRRQRQRDEEEQRELEMEAVERKREEEEERERRIDVTVNT